MKRTAKRATILLCLLLAAVAQGALEDFTTYTEQDTSNVITVTDATTITVNELDFAIQAFIYRDYGVGFFSGDFTQSMKVTTPVSDEVAVSSWISPWGITQAMANIKDLEGTVKPDFIYVVLYRDASSYKLYLGIYASGVASHSSGDNCAMNYGTVYYLTMVRDDDGGDHGTGLMTVYVCTGNYYDESGSSLVDTLSGHMEPGEQNDYRYLWAVNCFTHGGSYGKATDLIVEDLSLTGPLSSSGSPIFDSKLFGD